MSARFAKQRFIDAANLGINAGDLSGTVTGTSINCEGYNQATLSMSLSWAAASAVAVAVQASDDLTTWYPVQSASVAGGTATLSDISYSKSVSADDQWVINVPLNYKHVRFVVTSTGGTTDTITANCMLGVV